MIIEIVVDRQRAGLLGMQYQHITEAISHMLHAHHLIGVRGGSVTKKLRKTWQIETTLGWGDLAAMLSAAVPGDIVEIYRWEYRSPVAAAPVIALEMIE